MASGRPGAPAHAGSPGIPPSAAGYGAPRSGGNAALLRILGYLRNHLFDTVGATLALVLVTVSNLVAPQFISYGIDHGLGRRQPSQVLVAVAGLVVVAICRGVFTFAQGYLAERASQGQAYDLRGALFTRLEQLSFSYYDTMQTGQIMTRVSSDVEQVRQFTGTGVVQIVGGAFTLVGSLVLLVRINWLLTIVSLALLPIIFVGLGRFAASVGPLFGQVQQTLGRLNGVLREDLNGILVTRAFARERYETQRYDTINQQLLDKNLATIRAFANNYTFVFFVSNLVTLAVIWFGGSQVIGGHLTVGELIAFNTYLMLLLQMVLTVGFLVPTMARAGASALRVFDILDAPIEIQDPPNAKALQPIRGHVHFRNVGFRYPSNEHNTISDFSLEVQPGQTIAILGTTGSGKSTVLNLLPRFHDVTEGVVLIDGIDVREVTLHSLRHQIGIVLQELLLFSGTIRENIAYGRPDASQEEIEAAARAAMAHDFIMALPQGYDTVLGERGQGLSGGQRQRVAIARALLIDPRVLILDDSTSALDAETEAQIRQTIDRLMREEHRTVFVIAQRISTVRDADLIVVLDGGRIAAMGTHEQLVHESPLYNEILGSQLQQSENGAASTPSAVGGMAR